MLAACLELLMGCNHRNQTRPFTINKSCYTVCLDCGHELPYSSAAMRPLKRSEVAKSRYHAGEEISAAA
jgi:hypothetical protein